MSKYYVECGPETTGIKVIVQADNLEEAALAAIVKGTQSAIENGNEEVELDDEIFISQLGFISDRPIVDFRSPEEQDAWLDRYQDDVMLDISVLGLRLTE